jgi:GcrA cell cycle regulator
MSIWTPAVVKDLALLVDEGLSGSIIADRLSEKHDYVFSRSAILGKAYRLGLKLERDQGDPASTSQRRKRALSARGENAHVTRRIIAIKDALAKPVIPDPKAAPSTGISLFDLTDATCRWPTSSDSPFTFCGCQTQDGSPYCSAHHARAFAGRSSKPLNVDGLIGRRAA